MFCECLVYCSMRLGVPFIAPRQLGAVRDPFGRQFLPSVGWRTGQSFSGEADRCVLGPLGAPDSPMRPSDVGSATCRSLIALPTIGRGTPLAHRTVRCTPDSPVNFSRGALGEFPRAVSLLLNSLCTGQSGASQADSSLG
jgi:hypothetical protein